MNIGRIMDLESEKNYMKINFNEEISLEEYTDIQKWFFMKKKKMDYYLAAVVLLGIAIMLYSIFVRNTYYGTQWAIILAPFVYRPFCIAKIKRLAKKSYEKDITKWEIDIENNMIKARPKDETTYTSSRIRDIYMVYELKSVLLIYFNRDLFITISKKACKDDDYMKIRAMLYDGMDSRRVHFRRISK